MSLPCAKREHGLRWATWWIRQAVVRALANQARAIRLPSYLVEIRNQISRVQAQLHQEYGREPRLEEIVQRMEKSAQTIQACLQASQPLVSLEMPVGEGNAGELEDLLEDQALLSPLELAARRALPQEVADALGVLSERERVILQLRYGLGGEKSHTLTEVSKRLHVSRERVRQLEMKVLHTLRVERNEQLRDLLN